MALQTASWSDQAYDKPMVDADFAYSPAGALAAVAAACLISALLYALVVWPVATLAWIGGAAAARFLGRGPIADAFR